MYNRLQHLIDDDFCLLAWDDRHGRGVWAGLSTFNTTFEKFKNHTANRGKWDNLTVTCSSNAKWFPLVLSDRIDSALTELELKLSKVPTKDLKPNSVWSNAVVKYIEEINGIIDGTLHYGMLFHCDYDTV